MADNNYTHLIHANSSGIKIDGSPKLPSADRIEYGEIAVNYLFDREKLCIKNSKDKIITFSSDTKQIIDSTECVICKYVTTSANQEVAIISDDFTDGFNGFEHIIVDDHVISEDDLIDDSYDKLRLYKFEYTGKHTVKYFLKNPKLIEENMFDGLNFQSCIVPDTIRDIMSYSFNNVRNISQFTIGEKVTKIEENAFAGCDNLTEITVEAMIPPALKGNDPGTVFPNINDGLKIYVHPNVVQDYKNKWPDYENNIEEIDYIL